MRKSTALLAMLALTSSLSGCVIVAGDHDWRDKNGNNYEDREERNRAVISQLNLGDSRANIVESLGTPDFSEAFDIGQDHFRVLYFRTQRTHSDGITTPDETTPVIFRNDLLVGWGQKALLKVRPDA